jgi:hypothetical protein
MYFLQGFATVWVLAAAVFAAPLGEPANSLSARGKPNPEGIKVICPVKGGHTLSCEGRRCTAICGKCVEHVKCESTRTFCPPLARPLKDRHRRDKADRNIATGPSSQAGSSKTVVEFGPECKYKCNDKKRPY